MRGAAGCQAGRTLHGGDLGQWQWQAATGTCLVSLPVLRRCLPVQRPCMSTCLPAAVCVILARAFHPRVSALVLLTFAAYAAWTVALTRVR